MALSAVFLAAGRFDPAIGEDEVTADLAPARAAAVERALEGAGPVAEAEGVIGVIEIPRIAVRGEILEGVDDVTIRRAVGHFPESARPFEPGNMALAAHRTTHFRGLRDVRIGDEVTIRAQGGEIRYVVEETRVVSPRDVWVVHPTERTVLTLVTCYPFDYRGHAPSRFVVRARLIEEQVKHDDLAENATSH